MLRLAGGQELEVETNVTICMDCIMRTHVWRTDSISEDCQWGLAWQPVPSKNRHGSRCPAAAWPHLPLCEIRQIKPLSLNSPPKPVLNSSRGNWGNRNCDCHPTWPGEPHLYIKYGSSQGPCPNSSSKRASEEMRAVIKNRNAYFTHVQSLNCLNSTVAFIESQDSKSNWLHIKWDD